MALMTVWSGQVLIVAPLGASCVLLFGYPRSPLAQPRNVVLGNTLGGSLLLVLLAWAFSRWVPGAMPYPLHWLGGRPSASPGCAAGGLVGSVL